MRREPSQRRSREMVERIVTAARAVLVADGYDAFSTNRVAAAAGISPGSLYQYFADKTAILDVVVDRYVDETAEQVLASLGDRLGPLDRAAVRAGGDALLRALESDRELLRVVTEQLPPRRLLAQRTALEKQVTRVLAATLAASGRRDAAMRAWFTVLAVEQLATRWVLDRPDIAREDFLDHLAALLSG